MSRKLIKYCLFIGIAGLLAYKSVYFKKLDTRNTQTGTELDPAGYAQQFWTNKFIPYMDSAVELNSFLKIVKEDRALAFKQYSHTPGIGNTSFFLVKGESTINNIGEDHISLITTEAAGGLAVNLTTGMYFGNAVRDVSGLISMGDFLNTMDFNSVSSELNKIVRTQVIKPFLSDRVKGETIRFIGCIQLHKEKINTDTIEIMPVRVITN